MEEHLGNLLSKGLEKANYLCSTSKFSVSLLLSQNCSKILAKSHLIYINIYIYVSCHFLLYFVDVVKNIQYLCVCVCYSSYKQNTEEKHTLILRCRKSILQNFTWIHNFKKKPHQRHAASALSWDSQKEPCSHSFNKKGTDWLQTHEVPGQNHSKYGAET